MARDYPKFLFQNHTTGKSAGRFMVHLMAPRALFRITDEKGTIHIKMLEAFEDFEEDKMRQIANRALELYRSSYRHVAEGEIDLFAKGLPLKDAFGVMIKTKAVNALLGTSKQYVSQLKKNIELENFPSCDVMHKLLKLAGWVKTQDECWSRDVIK